MPGLAVSSKSEVRDLPSSKESLQSLTSAYHTHGPSTHQLCASLRRVPYLHTLSWGTFSYVLSVSGGPDVDAPPHTGDIPKTFVSAVVILASSSSARQVLLRLSLIPEGLLYLSLHPQPATVATGYALVSLLVIAVCLVLVRIFLEYPRRGVGLG